MQRCVDGEFGDDVLTRVVAFDGPAFLCSWEGAFGAFAFDVGVEGEVGGERLREAVDVVVRDESHDHVGHDLAVFPRLVLGEGGEVCGLGVVEDF